jgi:hypothetical protein
MDASASGDGDAPAAAAAAAAATADDTVCARANAGVSFCKHKVATDRDFVLALKEQ